MLVDTLYLNPSLPYLCCVYLHAAVCVQGYVALTVFAILPGEVGQVAGPQGEPTLLPVPP